MKILIGDSDVHLRKILSDFLRNQGHEVTGPPDAASFVAALQMAQPDFVFLDVSFSTDLLFFLKRISEMSPSTGVVTMGKQSEVALAEEATLYGSVGFIRKEPSSVDFLEKIRTKVEAAKQGGQVRKKTKILIVDDDLAIRQMLALYLKRKGYDPQDAPGGAKALEMIRAEDFELVLLDYLMPGMDGLETFQKIKEIRPDLGVIMVTAISEERIWKKARELGAYDYLVKPVDLKYLDLVLATKLALL